MSFTIALGILLVGFALLVLAGDGLIRAAISLSHKLKISPVIVGLTIVSLGTSTPEIFTSWFATIHNHTDIAIANIVGSNLFNWLFITGATALVTIQKIDKPLVSFEIPFLLGITTILFYFFSDGRLDPVESWALGGILAFYFILVLQRRDKKDFAALDIGDIIVLKKWWKIIGVSLLSMTGLAAGAQMVISGGVFIAEYFGVSERLIGLTMISMGTGLPELIASLAAAYRKQTTLAFSNIVGSNIINVLAIPAVAGSIKTIEINEKIRGFDSYVLLGSTAILGILIVLCKYTIPRWLGALLILSYSGYLYMI